MTDRAFQQRARAALAAIEQSEGVRILLAVESGSRAWGFASRDSDYDIRFIFVRPLADYLRVSPPRDVIDRPIDDMLDLAGWDIRKALGLLVTSNAVVLEWLASPVVYRSNPAAVAVLAGLASRAAHLPALAYHYDRLARGAWTADTADIRLKAYCYAVRPVLALLWMRQRDTPPPMDVPALLAGVTIPAAVHAAINELLACKAVAVEAGTGARRPVLDRFLAEALAEPEPRPATWDTAVVRAAADDTVRAVVLPQQ